jgi:hypothetical protein
MKSKLSKLLLAFSIALFLVVSAMATFANNTNNTSFSRLLLKRTNTSTEAAAPAIVAPAPPSSVDIAITPIIAHSLVQVRTTDASLQVVKGDYKYYFKSVPGSASYTFVYAQREPSIEATENHSANELVKILINEQPFLFTMSQGRIVCIETKP